MTTMRIDRPLARSPAVKRLLLPGLLLAAVLAGPLARAGENGEEQTANVAMEDTPARRTPSPAAPPEPQRDAGPGPGGAIFNPLAQVGTAAAVADPAIQPESGPGTGTTIAVAVGALAALWYLARRLT
ncbi:hypothetical protein [Variovorax sp. J31P207]|uniref:hypothetical protein n=1 Tax=Variovorax sp. J31P207 TaxID=3053510 RepID=UPI0025768F6C|nr:hypothetical protein [Variovorax sp. J31P207]MDM0071169.1 hypothetical protein [Variovorax sp. J31P207]